MNETINILMNRSSVRVYQDKPIEKDILDSILKAGLASASAGNLQPVSIIKIENKINSQWFVDHHTQALVGKAPLNLLFCLDFHRLKKWSANHKAPFVMDKSFRHFWVGFQDVIIMAQTIETAANAYGIGSVYIGTIVDMIPDIQERYKLPKGVIPVVLLSMGYPTSKRKIAQKLSIDVVVHNEEYQDHSIEFLESEYKKKYGEPKTDLNEDRIKQILQVVLEVDGEEKKKEVEEYLKTIDKVSIPMRYFGLHYVANYMARDNTEFLEMLHDNGFIWAKGENHPDIKE
ncbi:MAG: nitroreductase family protein [Tenericutes bacterium]|nr:nitroreductase family protein [Mycoplasmatota bacterium]